MPTNETPLIPQLGQMTKWEAGELNDEDTTTLFQELIDSNMVWHLRKSYALQALALVESGHCGFPFTVH